jgi:glycine dehydrogenase subunit 1
MCAGPKRRKVLVSACVHPDVLATVRTYAFGSGVSVGILPEKDGVTDLEALGIMADSSVACVYIQQPNFYGQLENAEGIAELTHGAGARFIMGCNPISLAILKSPAACGADIAVGEGQPLGIPLSFGGPYLGFMATKRALMRALPGRIVGQTTDADGKRAFVLTLQAREQHIRREKAASNICSNEALCAMTAAVYMAAMGPEGLAEAARQCVSKAHYFAQRLCEIPGVTLTHGGEFFHEFVTTLPAAPESVLTALAKHDILGGLPIEGGILWCVTEAVSKAELDDAAEIVKNACYRDERGDRNGTDL